ncbi:MAG: DUF1501 domain-containing protein [Xanthomonadales bacterium]|nr:DUF1501 domain-containing protein [Xanthomonadales bacterium]
MILASSAAGMAGVMPRLLRAESCVASAMPRTLINVMLQGGADFRYLFMPAPSHPDSLYLDGIWNARSSLYSADYGDYQQMFDSEYLLASDPLSGLPFGIHNSAAWLHSQFEAGQVAVIANAYCSRNRRHDQSILNADAGEPDLAQLNFDRAGWGGRLIEAIPGSGNVVELGSSVSVFSKGSQPGDRMARVVHAENMRGMALAGQDEESAAGSRRNVLARALNAWYEGRGPELANEKPPGWAYQTFVSHRSAIQQFGLAIDERLAQCQPLPDELLNLELNNGSFAQQCRNLFDACQLPDVLDLRVMSMSYGGWDTHDNLAVEITENISDIFGAAGGLATTFPLLDGIPFAAQPVSDQLVMYFASDFGRQLAANGTFGTDHGRGTYSIMLGKPVQGGIYGELFPAAEALASDDGRIPLQTQGADISGRTSTEKILAEACEWVEPGTSTAVFPNAGTADIETPGMLDSLLS